MYPFNMIVIRIELSHINFLKRLTHSRFQFSHYEVGFKDPFTITPRAFDRVRAGELCDLEINV